MLPKQGIPWHFPSPHMIMKRKKLFGMIQIFLIASLLLNSFGEGHVVAVDKTATFTTILNTSTVQEPPPFLLIDNGVDQENLTRVYLDAHLAGYVSKDVALNIKWPHETASKVWGYAKKTYGSYGHDPHIYVLLCVDTTTQGSTFLYNEYATHLDADYGFKNIVKFRKQSKRAWTKEVNKTTELLNFASFVGRIVESSSRNTEGSPGYNNYYDDTYRSSAWNFIFVYDVFLELEMNYEAESFLAADPSSPLTRNDQDIQESLDQDDRVNWIKNWFWPIYSKYRDVQALSQFIKNCYSYFPRKLLKRADTEAGTYYEYTKTMNKGEFVHFWSGSIGVDTRYLANFAFTWDTNDEKNFQTARKTYPMLKYQCNETSCKELPVLDQLVTGVQNNITSNLNKDKTIPAITVISENINFLEETFRKRVKGTLYRPLNQSERYLYDGQNELYIFETYGLCYYITCSAPYIIKWVTNIPLEESLTLQGCQTGNYLDSRRLEDPTNKNKASQGQEQETLSHQYTIQLIMSGITHRHTMGLLKCESIQNSTRSIHIYLKDKERDPETYEFPQDIEIAELFWSHTSEKKLILPCMGTSLKKMPNLKTRTKGNLDADWRKWITIWDKQNKSFDAELRGYNVTYDLVIGFSFAYEIWPFGGITNTTGDILFECFLNANSKMRYKVYVTSEEKELTSKLTIVNDGFEIDTTSTGCFLVKNSDRFLFVGNITDFEEYPLKLIGCSTPDECDFFRQCLDSRGKYCYSDIRKPQADYLQLKKPHSQGLFRCFHYQRDIRQKPIYEYTFVGLDKIRYVLSEDIPKKAIIYLEETSHILLTNVPANFRCQIATFVLVPNIRFALVYSNKTIALLSQRTGRQQMQSVPYLSSIIGVYDVNDVSSVINANSDQGIGWKNINVNLTADIVGVMCFAPLQNSTKWVNATRSFVAKDIKIPEIVKASKISRRVFGKDEQHYNLNCESSGVPDPEIKWILPNKTFALENILVMDNSYLKFPLMKEQFAGKYTCVASNLYGNDSYEFLLEYKNSGLGWKENIGIGFAVAFVMILLGFTVFLLLKYQNTSRQLRDLTEEEIKEFTHGKKGKLEPKGNINISLLPFDKHYILNPKELMIENGVVLGSGNFGIVYRGLLNGRPVAVKTLKSTADILSVKSLLGELKIMSFIGHHDHVVYFFGAVIEKIQKRAVEAVVELSPFGDLKNYLRNIFDSMSTAEPRFMDLLVDDSVRLAHAATRTVQATTNKISILTLIDWCRQIASGMNFLASKRVYHGDLAARNILVFENNTLKITDFGMSKQLYYAASYVKKEKIALPWRWMAIETLRFQEFSIESDVWAFGVTMWEIFSLGKLPFPGLNWTPEFMTILSTGMRMAKPEYCTKYLYDLMLRCWCEKPRERLTFSQLMEFFQLSLEKQQSPMIAEYINQQNVGDVEINYVNDN